jgi:hypothetical protein
MAAQGSQQGVAGGQQQLQMSQAAQNELRQIKVNVPQQIAQQGEQMLNQFKKGWYQRASQLIMKRDGIKARGGQLQNQQKSGQGDMQAVAVQLEQCKKELQIVLNEWEQLKKNNENMGVQQGQGQAQGMQRQHSGGVPTQQQQQMNGVQQQRPQQQVDVKIEGSAQSPPPMHSGFQQHQQTQAQVTQSQVAPSPVQPQQPNMPQPPNSAHPQQTPQSATQPQPPQSFPQQNQNNMPPQQQQHPNQQRPPMNPQQMQQHAQQQQQQNMLQQQQQPQHPNAQTQAMPQGATQPPPQQPQQQQQQRPQPLTHQAAVSQAAAHYSQQQAQQQNQPPQQPNQMAPHVPNGLPLNPPQSATQQTPNSAYPALSQGSQGTNTHKFPIGKTLTLDGRTTTAVQGQPSRPTYANSGMMGQPGLQRPAQFTLEGEGDRVLSKRKLDELVRQVTGTVANPSSTGSTTSSDNVLSPDVEEAVLTLADDFVDNVITSACRLAKLRSSQTLDIRDIQMVLERNYGIRIPGYGLDEVRTVRKFQPAAGWTQKMQAVQAGKVMGGGVNGVGGGAGKGD